MQKGCFSSNSMKTFFLWRYLESQIYLVIFFKQFVFFHMCYVTSLEDKIMRMKRIFSDLTKARHCNTVQGPLGYHDDLKNISQDVWVGIKVKSIIKYQV